MISNSRGKFIIVGTGPGDPDLISIKGIKAIQQADAILYDATVHPDILTYAKTTAKLIFVGNQSGKCEYGDQHLNEKILFFTSHCSTVVRLKSGNPFVFGRGYDELNFARDFCIDCEVIPGISSCIAVPESQMIPVTCRGINESFWVISGTTKNHSFSKDIQIAAQSTATIIILMGMNYLEEIMNIYRAQGKGHIPVAIIQNGTLSNEITVTGRMECIQQIAKVNGLTNPAVIVIGEVVSLHAQFIKETIASQLTDNDFSFKSME